IQPDAFRHLAEAFYLEGIVDDSLFHYEPMNFTPSQSATEMAKKVSESYCSDRLGSYLCNNCQYCCSSVAC
ncbi:hypothetical protein KA005_61425, partial [bacterium]|nr:hypothetical protein [bacterium]